MGYSTSSGRVPFAVQNLVYGEIGRPGNLPDFIVKMENDETESYPNIDLGKGWTTNIESSDNCVEHDDMYLTMITHESGLRVYYVNECEYSAGGGLEPTICAMSRTPLEKFVKDFNIDEEIISNAKLYQTL